MTYVVSGLPIEPFRPLFGLSTEDLAIRGVVRRRADARPVYPCRVTLRDAEPGDTLLLLHHVSHDAPTPYRSAYAIFVNEAAEATERFEDRLPPVFDNRTLALRIFDAQGMLVGAKLAAGDDLEPAILEALREPQTAYIHAHNAAAGCFAARIDRS